MFSLPASTSTRPWEKKQTNKQQTEMWMSCEEMTTVTKYVFIRFPQRAATRHFCLFQSLWVREWMKNQVKDKHGSEKHWWLKSLYHIISSYSGVWTPYQSLQGYATLLTNNRETNVSKCWRIKDYRERSGGESLRSSWRWRWFKSIYGWFLD